MENNNAVYAPAKKRSKISYLPYMFKTDGAHIARAVFSAAALGALIYVASKYAGLFFADFSTWFADLFEKDDFSAVLPFLDFNLFVEIATVIVAAAFFSVCLVSLVSFVSNLFYFSNRVVRSVFHKAFIVLSFLSLALIWAVSFAPLYLFVVNIFNSLAAEFHEERAVFLPRAMFVLFAAFTVAAQFVAANRCKSRSSWGELSDFFDDFNFEHYALGILISLIPAFAVAVVAVIIVIVCMLLIISFCAAILGSGSRDD